MFHFTEVVYCFDIWFVGNHPELAKQLFEEGLFFITSDTVRECGDSLSYFLEVWVDEEKHGPDRNTAKVRNAN